MNADFYAEQYFDRAATARLVNSAIRAARAFDYSRAGGLAELAICELPSLAAWNDAYKNLNDAAHMALRPTRRGTLTRTLIEARRCLDAAQ